MNIIFRLEGVEFGNGHASFLHVLQHGMKGKYMKNYDENFELHFRPRPYETLSVRVPKDTLESIEKVAQSRDMSCEALIRFYIGQGLREDLSRRFADHVLETTARVLRHHIKPEEKLSEIMEKIQNESVAAEL